MTDRLEGLRARADEVLDTAGEAGQSVQGHPAYLWAVRIGLYCYGLVHLLLAFLVLGVVQGRRVDASNQGSLATLATLPMGNALLVVLALGMASLVVWMVLQTLFGYRWLSGGELWVRKLSCAGRAVVYATLAIGAAGLALHGRISNGNSSAREQARSLFTLPLGRELVALVGLGVAVAAADQVQRGIRRSFLRYDLQGGVPRWAVNLGVAGWVSKGIVLGVVAVLFWTAAWQHDASRAGGLDLALRTLRSQDFGQVLLCLVAAGLACFGVFCFVWAPRARHDADSD